MKALTLTQPWATLVAIGAKQVETRSWNTNHRGIIAIHAAKGFPNKAKRLVETKPVTEALSHSPEYLRPGVCLGRIIAIAEIDGVFSTNYASEVYKLSEQERAFGDYSPGRFGWKLKNVRRLKVPIEVKGALQLWNWQPPLDLDELLEGA